MLTIERISPQSFPALAAEWRELQGRATERNLFSTHAWLRRWLDSFGTGHAALVARDASGIAAAIVLRFEGKVAHHLEDHTYWPDVLARPGHGRARRRLLEHLHREGFEQVVLLARDDDAGLRGLESDATGLYAAVPKWTFPTHAVDTAQSFEAYLDSRRGKVRSELKRKNRRFGADVEKDALVAHGPHEAHEAMAAIRSIEACSWKDDVETAIVSNEAELHFYESVLALDEEGAEGCAYVLVGDGEPRAFVLGVRYEGCFNALKTSYRAVDARLSPGQVLFYRVIERLCDDPGIDRLELLGRDSRWKQELATETVTMRTYELQRHSLRSMAAKMAEQHVMPRVRVAIDENPKLGAAVLRARDTLAAARRFLSSDDDTEQPT